jgi:Xanthosine triphosphate pyrophosphatase
MDLIIASNNAHKIAEFRKIIGDRFDNIYSMKDKNIDMDIAETGSTFMENAEIKAKAICDKFPNYAVLADDSGLSVDALSGAPGVMSARYAGNATHNATDSENRRLLLKNMQNITNRSAHFTTALCLIINNEIIKAEGYAYGRIIHEEKEIMVLAMTAFSSQRN